ncbi:hypothetical protein [Lacinutrix jangbogonensis]|uniref:hypothetical protein n=1 Tax=Lacinutrix jangbogonensis TaxID=1469557 RepID=UPI00053D207E|nr:hypothetical protein [Lacinutrix jangbogonensis]
MKKLIPNHIPAKGWKGGFLKKHPEANYPKPNLNHGLEFTGNLDNIGLITRQQRVLWPEFTWETEKGAKDPKRCFQMFAPDISRMGYDDSGQSWSIICPQQGTFIPGIGTLNVEVTVTGQKGWVDESTKTQAIDLMVKPKIWFSPSAKESAYGKLLWSIFELNHLGFNFPSEKHKAIQLNTFRTDKEKTRTISLRDGLFLGGNIPAFTDHSTEAWNHANLEVEIGDIDASQHDLVTEFNELIMKAFNAGSGNMLQKGNILAWNVWFDAPTKANTKEWTNHAVVWRKSIDVDHCSPDGNGSIARFANGKPFSATKELEEEILADIIKFIKKHLP